MTSPKLIKAVMEWYEQGKTVVLFGIEISCTDFLYQAHKQDIQEKDVYAKIPNDLNSKLEMLWGIVEKLEDEVMKLKKGPEPLVDKPSVEDDYEIHNPQNISMKDIPEGWRLLRKCEVHRRDYATPSIRHWRNGLAWGNGSSGASPDVTYITNLSPEELAQLP